MRIVWTELAIRDLGEARSFIAADGPSGAQRQVELVLNAITRLSRFPESGRQGRVAGTRELVVVDTPFVVAYRSRAGALEVLRVLHGRRRWPDRL